MAGVPGAITDRHNLVLGDPTVRTAVRHFGRIEPRFVSGAFVSRLSSLSDFPSVSVGDLIAAARAADVQCSGVHADWDDLRGLQTPFLTYLRRSEEPEGLGLIRVEEVRSRSLVFENDRFGRTTMSIGAFRDQWSGIVLVPGRRGDSADAVSELEEYRRQVSILPDVLSREECATLIRYCEETTFSRSRAAQRRGHDVADVVSVKARSSSSTVLHDRSHPILARLYDLCASLEHTSSRSIETIQCVRYKRGQQFKPHFDGGVGLPRRTTYLLYLNDDFTGGETHFPMLDLSVQPVAGSCLRFPSCAMTGEILWPSEHGGLPVTDGIKYALNIWVRCPAKFGLPGGIMRRDVDVRAEQVGVR